MLFRLKMNMDHIQRIAITCFLSKRWRDVCLFTSKPSNSFAHLLMKFLFQRHYSPVGSASCCLHRTNTAHWSLGVSAEVQCKFLFTHSQKDAPISTRLSCVLLFCSHQFSKAAETEPERHPGPVCCSGLSHLTFLYLKPGQEIKCLLLSIIIIF